MASGADIQVEKGGFTRIHNAILEHIVKAHFSSREYSAVLYLLRVTYGYQTTTAKLSGTQWEQGTGIKRQNIMAVVAGLVERNIILQEGGGRGRGNVATYKFNKYFDKWDCPKNESPSIHFTSEEMNPGECILGAENESPSMQENESPSMQCTSGLKKEKKVGEAAAAKPSPRTVSDFVKSYEGIWGLTVSSPYIGEQIQEWESRVTFEGWCYALQECADTRNVGNWKYFRRILERLEREGYQPKKTVEAAPSTLDFAVGELA